MTVETIGEGAEVPELRGVESLLNPSSWRSFRLCVQKNFRLPGEWRMSKIKGSACIPAHFALSNLNVRIYGCLILKNSYKSQ